MGELLLLRNGARWTVRRSKVLALSAEQVGHKQHVKFSSSISFCPQPALRRRKRAPQSLCQFKGTTIRATCWGGGFGDVLDAPSRGFSQRLLVNQALGHFLRHLLSWEWKQFLEQLLSTAWIHTKQALQMFDSSTYSCNTPFWISSVPLTETEDRWGADHVHPCVNTAEQNEYLLHAVP